VFNEGTDQEIRYRIPLTGQYLPQDGVAGKGVAAQAFHLLYECNTFPDPVTGGTQDLSQGGPCSFQIILTQNETITSPHAYLGGFQSSPIDVYLAAEPNHPCKLSLDGPDAYFYLDGYCNLTFDGNLTIDGCYNNDSTKEKSNPMVYLYTKYSQFVMAGNGVVLQNSYNKAGGVNTAGGGAVGLVNANMRFIMEGGRITGNTATSGGGVFLNCLKKVTSQCFVMNGGSISGNHDLNGDADNIYFDWIDPQWKSKVYWGSKDSQTIFGYSRASASAPWTLEAGPSAFSSSPTTVTASYANGNSVVYHCVDMDGLVGQSPDPNADDGYYKITEDLMAFK
jgi:hypothetical protein